MILCGKCSKQIKNPTYYIEKQYLCGIHAKEHAKEEIHKLKNQIMII